MLKVGLTGGIGCGKSTVARLFEQYGVIVVDADDIAKALVESGKPALDEIAQCFGSSILTSKGQLNRALLKKTVFGNDHLLNQLESILHPRIRQSITQRINELTSASCEEFGSPRYLIVDVPLLVEKGYQDLFDEIIVVDCTKQQQVDRVFTRDGLGKERDKELDKEMIENILSKQATRKERLEIATKTLDNSGSIGALERQVKGLHLLLNR